MTREEAIRILASSCIPGSKQTEALETLIPELAESEDERIRKVIYKLLLGMREEIFTSQDDIVTKDKALAYLEKQKLGKIPPYVTGIKGDPDPAGVWKPSEEQMKALQNAVALTACDKELARLYNQLKKLGVEEEPEYYQHFDPDC